MTTPKQHHRLLRWQLIGTLALCLVLAITPFEARSATYDFGELDSEDPSREAITVGLTVKAWKTGPSSWRTSQTHSFDYLPDKTGKRTETLYQDVDNIREPLKFEHNYTFSLTKPTGLRGLFFSSVNHEAYQHAHSQITIALRSENGNWETKFDNFFSISTATNHDYGSRDPLSPGNYTLIISGLFSFPENELDIFKASIDGEIEVTGVGGDAPLPGALVLLGTAIAGAGVWGRRKARKTA